MTVGSTATKIASWGNSDAIRIPRAILKSAGLASGDGVEVVLNERNNIEIIPKARQHRRVKPMRGITFETLFAGYDPSKTAGSMSPAWPDDNMVGAEFEAWSR